MRSRASSSRGGRDVMVLERINSPDDLKRLGPAELSTLADELRHEIIRVVSRNGGHLAPSLGVVELTIALHYVFDSPRDRIIWDVGHQSYAHKLLTGRRASFDTLRQHGGIAGFPRREESPHDAFGTRATRRTSISAALGMAYRPRPAGRGLPRGRGDRRRGPDRRPRFRGPEPGRPSEEEPDRHPERQQDVDLASRSAHSPTISPKLLTTHLYN